MLSIIVDHDDIDDSVSEGSGTPPPANQSTGLFGSDGEQGHTADLGT